MYKQCKCGCGIKILSRDKKNRERFYVRGHHNLKPRELRDCACGCGNAFVCIVTSSQMYIEHHQNSIVGFKKGYTPHNKGVSFMPKNIASFIEGGKKTRFDGSVSGENHPMYKDGRTPEMQLLRQKFRQTVSPFVLARDGYTCVLCGQKGGDLHVDHIKGWSNYPELRFEMSNCRTLCIDCHYKRTFKVVKPPTSNWGKIKKVRY